MVRQEDDRNASREQPQRWQRFRDSLPPKRQKHFETFLGEKLQEAIVITLTNMVDAGVFRKMWGQIYPQAEEALLRLRDEAQVVWNPETPVEEKDRILTLWLTPTREEPLPWMPSFATGKVCANPKSLPAIVAMTLLDSAQHLARCHNPECPAPYFIGKRKKQKFCEQGDCTAYAQRQYANAYWRRKRLATDGGTKKSRDKRGRK